MNVSAAQTIQDLKRASANKRSRWVAATVALQLLWALALITLSAYLLVLASGRPRASGLKVSAAIIAFPGVIAAEGGVGLWRLKRWGWWLSLLCDLGIVAALVYGIIDDATYGLLDWSMIGTALVATILPAMLLFPAVRRFYLRRRLRPWPLSS